MKEPAAFWDSSALTPLCVLEPGSPNSRALTDRFTQVVWWATTVEIHSAIARRGRSGMTKADRDFALERLNLLQLDWTEITPGDEVRDQAATLLHLYQLRAADSLQLAAALIWCRNHPVDRTFICADTRLCEAAAQAGFTVLRP